MVSDISAQPGYHFHIFWSQAVANHGMLSDSTMESNAKYVQSEIANLAKDARFHEV